MDARSTRTTSPALTWPLLGSVLLTAVTVAFVCERPASALHSWRQVFTLATLYLLVAGSIHALAVWGVLRIREESKPAGWQGIWTAVWAAWVAIVWLPLIGLLTSEHSPWVALILPVTVIFGTLLLSGRAASAESDADFLTSTALQPELFRLESDPPLWRVLLPAIFTAIAWQTGLTLLSAGHHWTAGCLLGAGTVYPLERWLGRSGLKSSEGQSGRWKRTSAGNSLLVWLMLVLALVPLLVMYAAGALSGLMGIRPLPTPRALAPSLSHSPAIGYSGVILFTPRKSREVVVPQPLTASDSLRKSREIDFDGAYWFYKAPDTRPQPNARVAQGDPVKNHVRSTDMAPLIVEAHQPLSRPLALDGARSLRVNVTNADNVPGTISLEILLRDTTLKGGKYVSLGSVVLLSSAVSPMPLKRPPVQESLNFPMPRGLTQGPRNNTFNEITVRIKPEHSRSLAAPRVSIRNFVLER